MRLFHRLSRFSDAALLMFIAILAYLLLGSPCDLNAQTSINSSAIDKAARSVVKLHINSDVGCSAVRISYNVLVSAAHCFYNTDGKAKEASQRPSYIKKNRRKYKILEAEVGEFNLEAGKFEDWIILNVDNPKTALSKVAVAPLPKKSELEQILNNLGNFDEFSRGEVVWLIGYPQPFVRIFPRKGSLGKELFLSRGHLKNENAYMKHMIYLVKYHQYYDELIGPPPDDLIEINASKLWKKYMRDESLKKTKMVYEGYKKNGDTILHHTADVAYGTSGGGVFSEQNGKLIGITCMDAALGHREATYSGMGSLYRIDSICRQSELLSKMDECKPLE